MDSRVQSVYPVIWRLPRVCGCGSGPPQIYVFILQEGLVEETELGAEHDVTVTKGRFLNKGEPVCLD